MMDWNTAGYNAGQNLLLDRHKKLGAIRKAHSSLRRGTRSTVSVADDTWAYKLVDGSDVVYVLLNRSDSEKTVGGLPSVRLNDALLGDSVTGPDIKVPARGCGSCCRRGERRRRLSAGSRGSGGRQPEQRAWGRPVRQRRRVRRVQRPGQPGR